MDEERELQEPYSEMDDRSLAEEQSLQDQIQGRMPSNIMPEQQFEYKKFVNLPESQAEFITKIDKDVVFANLGGHKPSLEELQFQLGTIQLFEEEFVEEKEVQLRDQEGRFIVDKVTGLPLTRTILIFDEAFRPTLNYLKADYKFAVVASRAIGTDRAAQLDISSSMNIKKEFNKQKKAGVIGFGGN